MKVCVVGGAGFLGSHMVEYLYKQQHQVLVIDNFSVGRKHWIDRFAKWYGIDIGAISTLDLAAHLDGYDWVMNYAASPFIPDCIEDPIKAVLDNAVGALKVIEAATISGCSRILQVTSAEVYGNAQDGRLAPVSSYAAAKCCADHLIRCRWVENEAPVIGLRQFNCIGERETHQYVIPEIIQQVHQWSTEYPNSATVEIWLGNNSSRDFMYAGDAVRIAVEVLKQGEFGQCYDLGSKESHQIYDIAHTITKLMTGKECLIHVDDKRIRPAELWSLQADNTAVESITDMRPQYSFVGALRRTIKYFQDNNHQWDTPHAQNV